jgi:hypothetical protein
MGNAIRQPFDVAAPGFCPAAGGLISHDSWAAGRGELNRSCSRKKSKSLDAHRYENIIAAQFVAAGTFRVRCTGEISESALARTPVVPEAHSVCALSRPKRATNVQGGWRLTLGHLKSESVDFNFNICPSNVTSARFLAFPDGEILP